MSYSTWRDAATAVRRHFGSVSERQLQVAQQLGIQLGRRTPRLVGAVLLREALADVLGSQASDPPTDQQMEYLRDLAEAVGAKPPKKIPSRDQAEAWIEVMHARRALEALKDLKPEPGDIVALRTATDREVDEVASIGDDDRIYFRGGRGAGARVHRLNIVARRRDESRAAKKARERAANRRALRTRLEGPPTDARLAELRDFRADNRSDSNALDRFRDLLDEARDERPLQALLAEHPEMLAGLTVSSHGTFVRPLVRLGAHYVPDFVLVVADSMGLHYTLVELESPRAKVSLNDGQLAAKAREAVKQIEDWREWLKDHLAYAQKPTDQNGLGLPEIRPESPGLVLIGRRDGATHYKSRIVRQRLRERQGISVHTYDWLVEVLGPGASARSPRGPLDVYDDWANHHRF
jgi:hypothetical protein